MYEFGEFCLDVAEKQLRRRTGEVLTIPPKAFELLVFLVENPHHLLEKNELMDKVWADSFVEEGNLKIHIHTLRKALNEDGMEYIETIPRRGYRFNSDVNRVDNGGLIVEKITQSRLVIERTETDVAAAVTAGRSRSGRAVWVLGAIALTAVASIAYFGFIRPRNNTTAVAANIRPTTIAVLPFKNLTQDERDAFLSVGLTDALITRLSGMQHLVVRPTSSVLSYAASNESPQKIGETLKVEALLDGTIQRLDDRLRVSLQLISATDNHVVWAGNFEEADTDLFKFQDAFAADIASAMQFKVSQTELAGLKRLNTNNAEAYRLYLNARYFFSQGTADSVVRAVDLYQQAIKLDDHFALAYAGIGESYMVLEESSFRKVSPAEGYSKAVEAARRALELEPNLANAYLILGNAQAKWEWNIPEAERFYKRAIELDPNYARAHQLLAWNLIRQSRFEEAAAEFRVSSELDPTSLETSTNSGYPAFFAGDYDKAILQFQDALSRDKNFWGSHMNLWRALEHAGHYDEATTEIKAAEKISGPGLPVVEMAKGRTLARTGKVAAAREILNKLVARKQTGEYISPLLLAALASDLGDREAVFGWLDECVNERDDYMPFLTFAPEFAKYHDDPRFHDLLRRIGLES